MRPPAKGVLVDMNVLVRYLTGIPPELCRDSKRYSFTDAFLWAQARVLGVAIYSFDGLFPSEGIELLKLL